MNAAVVFFCVFLVVVLHAFYLVESSFHRVATVREKKSGK